MKIEKTCICCNEKFIAQTIRTKYCSHKCNRKHYKQRKRTKPIEQNNSSLIQLKNGFPQLLNTKPYLSLKETYTLLGISRSTLMRMIKSEKLETTKFGRKVIVKKENINELFKTFSPVQPNEKVTFNIDNCYYIGEIKKLYGINEGTINGYLNKHNIQKTQKGKYKYVLKSDIKKILGKPLNNSL